LLGRVLCLLVFLFWTAEAPVELDKILYCGLWRSPFGLLSFLWVPLPVIHQPAIKVLLVTLAPFCLVWPGAFRKRAWIVDGAILASLGSVGITLAWGLYRGGSAYQTYFQLNAFITGMIVALLLLCVIRTPKELRMLGTTVFAAAVVRGFLASYFYFVHVRGQALNPYPPYMTTHDDSLLFVAGLVIAICWAIARRTMTAWLTAASVSALLFVAIIVNNRRLAYMEILFALAVMYRMLQGRDRRLVNRWLLVGTPVVLLYAAVGFGRTESIFAPLRALSTTGSVTDNSSLARQEENGNLTHTLDVSGNLLLGTGWGQPYEKVTSVFANFGPDWWQYLYLPHDSLLGIAVFGGLVGLFGIWLVVPVTAFLTSSGYQDSTGTVERAAGMAVVGLLPAYTAQCFGDIGFQSLTSGLILGVLVAAGGKVYALSRGGAREVPKSSRRVRPSPPPVPGPRARIA
jgi:hypothetical protein